MRRKPELRTFLPAIPLAVASILASCSKSTEPPEGLTESTRRPAPASAPLGEEPGTRPPVAATGSTRVTVPGGLSYLLPAAWTSVPPSSQMRLAEFRIPAVEGDPAGGELVLFHFGPGQGGTVEGNVERWFKQFEGEGGLPARDAQKQERREVNSLPVTIVETAGTYTESVMASARGEPKRENWRLFGLIIETPKGIFFLKGTGPDQTMLAARPALLALVDSLEIS